MRMYRLNAVSAVASLGPGSSKHEYLPRRLRLALKEKFVGVRLNTIVELSTTKGDGS